MFTQGIYSIVLLVFSNIFMTFAWYGHLKMREEFSWFASLPLIGVPQIRKQSQWQSQLQ